MHMNWLHFKPEFLGKPDEDVEVNLLRTNDWMNTPGFSRGSKSSKILSQSGGKS